MSTLDQNSPEGLDQRLQDNIANAIIRTIKGYEARPEFEGFEQEDFAVAAIRAVQELDRRLKARKILEIKN